MTSRRFRMSAPPACARTASTPRPSRTSVSPSTARSLPGLFPVQSTGISTAPIKAAAKLSWHRSGRPAHRGPVPHRVRVVAPLEQRAHVPHAPRRLHGADDRGAKREAALDLMRATLSSRGYDTSHSIMKLNETIREITGSQHRVQRPALLVQHLGQPSDTEPWGWQVDGHHLIINYFVLGDQVVHVAAVLRLGARASPTAGKYAGTRVFDAEQDRGLALVQSLDAGAAGQAIVGDEHATPEVHRSGASATTPTSSAPVCAATPSPPVNVSSRRPSSRPTSAPARRPRATSG